MMSLEWQNPNRVLAELRRLLAEGGQRISRIPESAIRRATFELQARVKDLVPKKTATLARSISAVVERQSGGILVGRVGTHLKYAQFLEYGTGLYGPEQREIVITARNRKGLFWGAFGQDGRPIIRRQVRIKGMKPRASFGTAVTAFLPRYLEIVQQELAKAAS